MLVLRVWNTKQAAILGVDGRGKGLDLCSLYIETDY